MLQQLKKKRWPKQSLNQQSGLARMRRGTPMLVTIVEGKTNFSIGGVKVSPTTAEGIIAHNNVMPMPDSLIPGLRAQSYVYRDASAEGFAKLDAAIKEALK